MKLKEMLSLIEPFVWAITHAAEAEMQLMVEKRKADPTQQWKGNGNFGPL